MRKRIALAVMAAIGCALIASAQDKKINELTAEERASGWRLLFDGKTLKGWRGFHRQEPPPGWVVEAGAIKKIAGRGELGEAGGDLITVDQFANFEFQVEWKLTKGANSGIKYLVSEDSPKTGRSAVSFEYQVLDDDNHPDAKEGIAGNRTAGSLYDILPAGGSKKMRPIGEFNQTRIVKRGTHIEHWLNGVKVLEFEQGGPALKAGIATSKFKTIAGFGEAKQGHFLLQDHGNEVSYRNIKVRELK